jgi:tetratricopeptide (TPR) repeat protein
MRRLALALCLAATAATMGSGLARADSIGDVRTGNAAFGDGRYEAAVEAFTRAILAGDLPPEALAITFNNRGVAYSELGDFDRAISDCTQSLALTPGDPTATKNLRIAYLRRAAAAARLGERESALADYDRAIELDPAHPLAYLRRGQLRLDQGDREAAVADLTRARDLDPANADILAVLADAQRDTPSPTAALAATEPEPEPVPEPAPPVADEPPAPDPAEDAYAIDSPGGGTAATRPPAAPPPAATAVQPGAGPATTGPGRAHRVLADVNVRQGPSNGQPRIGSLAQGSTVLVVGEQLGWLQVRLVGGGTGYVYRRWLEPAGDAGAAPP